MHVRARSRQHVWAVALVASGGAAWWRVRYRRVLPELYFLVLRCDEHLGHVIARARPEPRERLGAPGGAGLQAEAPRLRVVWAGELLVTLDIWVLEAAVGPKAPLGLVGHHTCDVSAVGVLTRGGGEGRAWLAIRELGLDLAVLLESCFPMEPRRVYCAGPGETMPVPAVAECLSEMYTRFCPSRVDEPMPYLGCDAFTELNCWPMEGMRLTSFSGVPPGPGNLTSSADTLPNCTGGGAQRARTVRVTRGHRRRVNTRPRKHVAVRCRK